MKGGKPPRALAFDVFGTVVDWRSSIARESRGFLDRIGRGDIDAARFADGWRARYRPAMAAVQQQDRGFVILDVLHREMLVDLLADYDLDAGKLDSALIDDWATAWHRLDPWPDAVAGLARLRARFPRRDAVEREHRADRRDGAARGAGLGRGARRGIFARVQTCAADLSRCRRARWVSSRANYASSPRITATLPPPAPAA